MVLVERSSGPNYYPEECDINESAWVVGVARHRLWLRSSRSGRVCGYTRDSLLQQLNSGFLRVRCKHVGEENMPSGVTDILADVESVGALRECMMNEWTGELDRMLVRCMNDYASKLGLHPLLLSYSQLANFAQATHCLIAGHTVTDVLLRVVLLHLFNDTVIPMVPFLNYLPAREDSTTAERSSLQVVRRCLLLEAKRDIMLTTSLANMTIYAGSNIFKSCFPTINLFPNLPEIAFNSSNSDSWLLGFEDSRRVFYVRSEDSAITSILQDASINEAMGILFESSGYADHKISCTLL